MKNLSPLLLIVIALALVYWFTYPTYQKLESIKAEIAEAKIALTRAEAANATLTSKKQTYQSFIEGDPENVDKLNKLLPDRIDNFRWIVELSRIAGQHGGKVSDVRVTDDLKETSAVGAINVAFVTEMPYQNFLDLLTDLQKNLKLTDVITADFQSADAVSGKYKYTIVLKSYWLK